MKNQIVNFIVAQLAELVTNTDLIQKIADFIKVEAIEGIDEILDIIEDKTIETHNKIDDALILPLCKAIRIVLDIPDND